MDYKLSKLKGHILRGKPVVIDDPPLDLEGDSDELDDCVDEYAFSFDGEEGDEEYWNLRLE